MKERVRKNADFPHSNPELRRLYPGSHFSFLTETSRAGTFYGETRLPSSCHRCPSFLQPLACFSLWKGEYSTKEFISALRKLKSIKCGFWLLKSGPMNARKKCHWHVGRFHKMCGYFGLGPLYQHLCDAEVSGILQPLPFSSKTGQEASVYIPQNIRARIVP